MLQAGGRGFVASDADAEIRTFSPSLGDDELETWSRVLPETIAVTGATGFLGHHVVRALTRSGRRPRVLIRDTARLDPQLSALVEVRVGDLDDRDALGHLVSGCGTVVHLAGLVRAARASAFERANRMGTENIVEAMRSHAPAARLVYVSSLAAAGPSVRPQGRGPEEVAAPVSSYGRSKLGGEVAARRFDGPWVVLRPPAVYGPRDIDVFQFFRLVARGIVPLPAGERWVSVVHVSDVVRAIAAAADGRVDGRTLHLGEPSPRRMTQLVGDLAEAGGLRARVIPVPAAVLRATGLAGDLLQLVGFRSVAMTSDKARELCARHWSARTADSLAVLGIDGYVPFSAGSAQTWAWYRGAGWLPHAKIPAERTEQ